MITIISMGVQPDSVAVSPGNARVYVANQCSGSVSVVAAATNTKSFDVAVCSVPVGVAINAAGTRVYVANHGTNSVSVIDTAAETVAATVPVGHMPSADGAFIQKNPKFVPIATQMP